MPASAQDLSAADNVTARLAIIGRHTLMPVLSRYRLAGATC